MGDALKSFGVGAGILVALHAGIVWVICLFDFQGWAWALLFAVMFVGSAYVIGAEIR